MFLQKSYEHKSIIYKKLYIDLLYLYYLQKNTFIIKSYCFI